MPLRSLIADDEPAARELLAEMLGAHAELQVVGLCADAAHAIEQIAALRPDVLFLDIQMPGGSGFDVLEALQELGPEVTAPQVVFVTAYDAHAVRAFEVGALDYLLKPFDEDRLARTIERLREHSPLRGTENSQPMPAEVARSVEALAALEADVRPLRRLPMRVGERIQLIPVGAVTWFEADGKYIRVHVANAQGRAGEFTLRRTMQSLERRLDDEQFVRVNRSAIINVDHLRHAEPWSHGEFVLVLSDGARVTTTPGYRARIQEVLRAG